MKTQDQWMDEARSLLPGPGAKGSLTFDEDSGLVTPGRQELVLVVYGNIVPASVDSLARWCLEKCDLRPYGITAPSWSCSWTTKPGAKLQGADTPMRFSHWSLDGYRIGVFKEDTERSGFNQTFILPEIPTFPWGIYDDRDEEGRRLPPIYRKREVSDRLSLLALVHFASHLASRVADEPGPVTTKEGGNDAEAG